MNAHATDHGHITKEGRVMSTLTEILETMKREIEEDWGVHDAGTTDAIDSEVFAKAAIAAEIRAARPAKRPHASWCFTESKRGAIDAHCNCGAAMYNAGSADFTAALERRLGIKLEGEG